MTGVYLSRVFSSASYYSLFPFLVDLLTRRFHFDLWGAGAAMAVMLLASRVFAIPAGTAIDKFGAGPFIIFSNTISMAAVLGLDFLRSDDVLAITLLLLVRGTMGSGQGVAYKVITHRLSDKTKLTKTYSNLANAANVGVIVGPMLSMFPQYVGMTEIGVVAAFHFLSLLAMVPLACKPGEPGKPDAAHSGAASSEAAPPLSGVRGVFQAGAVAYMVEWLLIEQVILMLAYYCQYRLGSKELGAAFFSIQAIISVPVTYLLGRVIRTRTQQGYLMTFAVGGVILSGSFLLFGIVSEFNALVGVLAFAISITFAEAIGVPASDAYISSVFPNLTGKSFSVASLLQALGLAAGAILGAGTMAILEAHHAAVFFWPIFAAFGLLNYSFLLWRLLRRGLTNDQVVECSAKVQT